MIFVLTPIKFSCFSLQFGYHNSTKQSFKIFGTEKNVRKCLIDVMKRMFKHQDRSASQDKGENNSQPTPKTDLSDSHEVETINGNF